MSTGDRPGWLGHPAVLLTVAVGLFAIGVVLWILGYVDAGRHNGDRLAELDAGIVAGAVVSFAFWLVDRAAEERDRGREVRDDQRHERLIEHLVAPPAAPAPMQKSEGSYEAPST